MSTQTLTNTEEANIIEAIKELSNTITTILIKGGVDEDYVNNTISSASSLFGLTHTTIHYYKIIRFIRLNHTEENYTKLYMAIWLCIIQCPYSITIKYDNNILHISLKDTTFYKAYTEIRLTSAHLKNKFLL